MEFSQKVLEFRARHKLSQVAAADIIGVTPYMLWQYENGKAQPWKRNLIIFEKAMKEYDENN